LVKRRMLQNWHVNQAVLHFSLFHPNMVDNFNWNVPSMTALPIVLAMICHRRYGICSIEWFMWWNVSKVILKTRKKLSPIM
jgi:hypothetical protein